MPRKKKKARGKKVALVDVVAVLLQKEEAQRAKLKKELKEYKSALPHHLWAVVLGFALYREQADSIEGAVKRCLELHPDAFSQKPYGTVGWNILEHRGYGRPPKTLGGQYVGELAIAEDLVAMPDGWGRFTYSAGTFRRREWFYHGPWDRGKFSGENGRWEHFGFVYRGSFLDGKRHGRGVNTKYYDGAQGCTYKGLWKEDLMHGKGTLLNGDGALIKSGTWEYGEFKQGDFYYSEHGEYRMYTGEFRPVLAGAFGSSQNLPYGKGKQFDKDGRVIQEGCWDGGRLVSGKKYDYTNETQHERVRGKGRAVVYEGCFGESCMACIRTVGNVCTLGQWGPGGFKDFPSAHSDPFIYEPARYEDLLRRYCTPSSRSSSLTPTSEGRFEGRFFS